MEGAGVPVVAPPDAVGGAARRARLRLERLTAGVASRWCEATAWLASCAAAWVFAGFALRRHAAYESTAYDFGLFDQIIWNTAHGRWFETSFLGFNFLGQHVALVLVGFAGLYRLGADPGSILIVQAIFVGAAGIPLFYAVRRLTGSPLAALTIVGAFLLNPALHRALDFDFHTELMAFFFVFLALYFLAAGRGASAALSIAPVLLLKEDMAVVVAVFGVLMWMRGQRRAGGTLAAAGVAWGIIAVFVLMPSVRDGQSGAYIRYAYLTHDTTTMTVLPLAAWRALHHLADDTAPGVAMRLIWMGGVPLLNPAALLALPSIVLNGVASHQEQAGLDLQYVAAPLALFFVSSVLAIAAAWRAKRPALRRAAPVLPAVMLVAACAAFLWSSPFSPRTARYAPDASHRQIIEQALRLVPPTAGVSAQNTLVPHVSQRRVIREFPDVGEDTIYVVVDTSLSVTEQSSGNYGKVLAELPSLGFREIFNRDGVRVFTRATSS